MASSGTISKKITGREYRIEWSASQSIANNESTITCVHKLINDATYSLYIDPREINCTVGSDVKSTTSPGISTGGGSTITLGTTTHKVKHDNDGSKSVTITGIFYIQATLSGNYLNSITATGSVTLDTIARISEPTVSASSVQMGKSVTITTNRKADSLTHTLSYSFGGATGTIATGVGASYAWTVPDLVSKISGKKSGTCTITCKTYSGSTLIGSDTVTLTLTIPDRSTPTTSASTVKMGESVTIYTNRGSTGFTHTLEWKVGSSTGTFTSVGASKAWTPPKSLAAQTGNKTSADCTITCKTYNGSLLVGTATLTITLTVPDATVPKLSASSVAMGNKITISMEEEASVYTHSLTYTMRKYGTSTVVASGDITTHNGGDYEWTVPLSLAAKIPSDKRATIVVSCKTLIGGTTVGTKTASFTATVPENETTRPRVTMSVSAVETPFSGVYVAGKSKVKVAYTASSDYSTIAEYLTELLSYSSKTNPYTSPVLANAGTVSITGKVTDARGYPTSKTATITVLDYSRPRITPGEGKNQIICTRCNSDGKIDPGGVYLLIQIGRKYSKVVSNGTQKNFCKLSYQWKTDAQDESMYSDPVELLAKTAASDYVNVALPDIVTSNTTAYTIRLIAEDDVGESDTVVITVPTAFATWHAPVGGHGFTLGGYHDPAKYNVFDCRFDAEFNGTVSGSVLGLLGCSGEIPGDGDANDYKVPGVWAVASNADAETILNLPVDKAGLLRVYASTGQDYVTEGNWKYITQEYRSLYPGTPEYRRRLHTDGNGDWNYDNWFSGIDDIVHLAGSATQVNANIYTDNGVETCQFMIRAGDDYHVLNLTPTGIVYGKNGKVLWTK